MSAIALSFPEFRKAAATTSKPHPLKENSKILRDPHEQLSPLWKEPDDGSARSAQCGDRRRLSRQRSTKGSLGGRPLLIRNEVGQPGACAQSSESEQRLKLFHGARFRNGDWLRSMQLQNITERNLIRPMPCISQFRTQPECARK